MESKIVSTISVISKTNRSPRLEIGLRNFYNDYKKIWETRPPQDYTPGTNIHTLRQFALLSIYPLFMNVNAGLKHYKNKYASKLAEVDQQLFIASTNFDLVGNDKTYGRLNRKFLNESALFLNDLFSGTDQPKRNWLNIMEQFMLYHDYAHSGNEYAKASHEANSAKYYLGLGLRDPNKEIISFMIKQHITIGIPVLGELSSNALCKYVDELNTLNNITDSDKPIILKLAIIQAYLDSAASGKENGFVLPEELPFYYYLWNNTDKLLKKARIYYPSVAQIKDWAVKPSNRPTGTPATELAYRLFKLTKGLLTSLEGLTIEDMDSTYSQIRYFKSCMYDINACYEKNFENVKNIIHKFQTENPGHRIEKIIMIDPHKTNIQPGYIEKDQAFVIKVL